MWHFFLAVVLFVYTKCPGEIAIETGDNSIRFLSSLRRLQGVLGCYFVPLCALILFDIQLSILHNKPSPSPSPSVTLNYRCLGLLCRCQDLLY